MLAVGLMSGTSLDGIDAALVRLEPYGARYDLELLRAHTTPFPHRLSALLRAALPPREPSPRAVALLDALLGRALGAAARNIAGEQRVDFVASHGLTLYHDAASHRTMQIGDPYAIRDRTRATVVFDFRRADCAAGGQGAPLVPFADALLFGDAEAMTVALNLGGIANVTIVPARGSPDPMRAWDTGPGMMLIDAFVRSRSQGSWDEGGSLAARGRTSEATLRALLDDAYFDLAPPKSTGRERFGDAFFARHAAALEALDTADGCATLCALTVESIARELERAGVSRGRVVASGGGTHNATLLRMLAERLGSKFEVLVSSAVGIDPDAKEAMAFAVLGYETLRGRPAGTPSVTGARRAAVLGAIVPFALDELMAKLQREVTAKR
jgi:anhydro-N-acetylmuramic acid kinase